MGQAGGEYAPPPWGREGALREGGCGDQALEVVFEGTGDCVRATRAQTLTPALGPLSGKALQPLSEGDIRHVKGRSARVDVRARGTTSRTACARRKMRASFGAACATSVVLIPGAGRRAYQVVLAVR